MRSNSLAVLALSLELVTELVWVQMELVERNQ
jgi:hypothetical protein